ncbi:MULTISPECIES: DUF4294 domain-containing protein [Mediterranea]|uniref:DUF4294 domain-containing protein n=1 Tax=Mediterranea TaxID=1926659 RepID=UPI002011A4E1|nr:MULTISPECIES: DUF4294 domain-containing protein [Mediterranea]MCL1607019.1 DUF4294 domain-containing protein [Mediterranea sp. ET5]MDM8121705.1 DUF4294 domain-containing protein [Mediterranea massiliensis]MDM8197530.1 DUF4294 domain-containing protein [Mediterranea massiliensis]
MATIAEKMAFILLLSCAIPAAAQKRNVPPPARLTVSRTVYEGDSITRVDFYPLRVYPPLTFKSRRSERAYYKLVRDVKRTLPLARMINQILIETYEYMQTLPEGKAREEHIKRVEKGLKEQYTPMMKKLTFSQGKLLIKLVDRECNQTSYELVKAFVGPFRAGFYQTFASMFGASLKKEYDPDADDALTERVILMVESGQL